MLPEQVSGEMFPYHGERKKAEVSGGIPPAAPPLYPHRHLGICSTHCVSRGYSKNTRQSPHNQTETTLLLSVWLHKDYDHNHVGAGKHHCIWGYLVLACRISVQQPQWED